MANSTAPDNSAVVPFAPPAQQRGDGLPLVVVKPALPTAPPSRVRKVLRRMRFLPLIPLLVMTGGFIGIYFQPPGLQFMMRTLGLEPGAGTSSPMATAVRRPVESPPASATRLVVGLGRIIPLGETRTIAAPFGAGDARIGDLRVKEGDRVQRGDVLATLDNEKQFEAAVESARALAAAREATFAQVRASVRASRDEAKAALARAETTAANALREFERADELRRRGVATETTFDQRRAARDEAQREVERLRATLSRYGEDLDTQPDVVVAARNLDAAKADLARAAADLDKAIVRAPITGTVLTINTRAGEKPGAQGILNIGDLEQMAIEAEIHQSQIGYVSLGDSVEATADALPRPLRGTVTRIGLEVARQTLTDPSPAANTDARVVRITVTLDPDSTAIARRFTNLQVIAKVAAAGAQ